MGLAAGGLAPQSNLAFTIAPYQRLQVADD